MSSSLYCIYGFGFLIDTQQVSQLLPMLLMIIYLLSIELFIC